MLGNSLFDSLLQSCVLKRGNFGIFRWLLNVLQYGVVQGFYFVLDAHAMEDQTVLV